VVTILSNTLPALERMIRSDKIDIDDLQVLEHEWVSRAWTYQETVNAKVLHFTAEDTLVIVPADKFLNCIGDTLVRLKCSAVEKLEQYPRFSAFEDVIADYYTAGYEERSALQVMSNMDQRSQVRPEDHFYAMIDQHDLSELDWKRRTVRSFHETLRNERRLFFHQFCSHSGPYAIEKMEICFGRTSINSPFTLLGHPATWPLGTGWTAT